MTKWISVKERLPEAEKEVIIFANRNGYPIITTGMYEDGKVSTEESMCFWCDLNFEYDETTDTCLIPAGWWEYKCYNGDDEYNHPIDDIVTHWMSLPPEPEEASEICQVNHYHSRKKKRLRN